jgi:hypothetical protein
MQLMQQSKPDATEEPYIDLDAATEIVQARYGWKVSRSTIWRWSRRPIRNLPLRTEWVKSRLFTKRSWLEEFLSQRFSRRAGPA